jgi:hypothetical protein
MIKMKSIRTLVLAAALAVIPAAYASEEPGSSSGEAYWKDSSPVKVSVGGGASYFNGNTGWGVTGGVQKRISDDMPLYAGIDLGINVWNFNSSVAATSEGAFGIALLPSLVYGFSLKDMKNLRPYIGLALGPQLYIENRNIAGVGNNSDTRVYLEALVRVGANLAISDGVSLNLEPKFGLMGGRFVFLPTASAVFGI